MGRKPYLAVNGNRVPGVTTILGRFKDSGALIWWANQVGLGEHKSCDDQERCPKCYRRPGRTQKEAAGAAADVGNYAHALIEFEATAVPVEESEWTHLTDEQFKQADNCLSSWKRWRDNFQVEFLDTELRLVSEEHLFGGMVDSVARIKGGSLVLPDWKTSNGLYADYVAQIAAYGVLLDEHADDLFGEVEEYHILRISKNTAAFHHHSWMAEAMEPARRYFLHARQLYDDAKDLDALLK